MRSSFLIWQVHLYFFLFLCTYLKLVHDLKFLVLNVLNISTLYLNEFVYCFFNVKNVIFFLLIITNHTYLSFLLGCSKKKIVSQTLETTNIFIFYFFVNKMSQKQVIRYCHYLECYLHVQLPLLTIICFFLIICPHICTSERKAKWNLFFKLN